LVLGRCIDAVDEFSLLSAGERGYARRVSEATEERTRITVTVRADLVSWLRAKAQWQQRSMSSIVDDGLIDLREKMGEPGRPRGIERLPERAQSNLARLRERDR
jgi:hypothetical protein